MDIDRGKAALPGGHMLENAVALRLPTYEQRRLVKMICHQLKPREKDIPKERQAQQILLCFLECVSSLFQDYKSCIFYLNAG